MSNVSLEDHVQAVFRWLDEHVLKFDTPASITLFDIQSDAMRYKGSFRLQLDDVVLDESRLETPFHFDLGQNGLPNFYYPMFFSPLGAPASYAAVDLTDATEKTIRSALQNILPRMRPLGLDRETGQMLTYGASIEDRMLDEEQYERCFKSLTDMRYTLSVKP